MRLLRLFAEEKGMGLEAATLEFQNIIEKQGEQFQKFIKGMGKTRNPTDSKSSGRGTAADFENSHNIQNYCDWEKGKGIMLKE